jgi:hypothetical protein
VANKKGRPRRCGDNCLIPECPHKAKSRGLCSVCYFQARKAIDAGQTTWHYLEVNNLCLPLQGYSSAPVNLFQKALKQKLAKEDDDNVGK